MLAAGLIFAFVAALLHIYIFILESLRWTHPRTMQIFGVGSAEEARITRPLAFNQGFYNLFLAVGALLGIALTLAGNLPVGATLIFFATGSILAAGLVLVLSDSTKLRASLLQIVPAVLAIGFLLFAL